MEATEATEAKTSLVLPIAVVSPTDIARIFKELDNLDEFFRQSAIRSGGVPQALPRYSRVLDEVVVANKLNLLDTGDRELLKQSFHEINDHAPVMHISFSVDPPGPYVQKIVDWLRHNIDPTVLVRVGLQPNIGAGCVVRTTNKSFDFSLRKFFESKHEFFMEKLHEVLTPEEVKDPMFDSQAAEPAQTNLPPSPAQSPEPVAVAQNDVPANPAPIPASEVAVNIPVAVRSEQKGPVV